MDEGPELLTDTAVSILQTDQRFPKWAKLSGRFNIDNSVRLSEFGLVRIDRRRVLGNDYEFSKRGICFTYCHQKRVLEARPKAWRRMPSAEFVFDNGSWWVRSLNKDDAPSPWIKDWAYWFGSDLIFDCTCLESGILDSGYGRTSLHAIGPLTLTREGGVQIGSVQYFEPRFTFSEFEYGNVIVRRLGRTVEICDLDSGDNYFYHYHKQLWFRCFISHYELIRVARRRRRLKFLTVSGLTITTSGFALAVVCACA